MLLVSYFATVSGHHLGGALDVLYILRPQFYSTGYFNKERLAFPQFDPRADTGCKAQLQSGSIKPALMRATHLRGRVSQALHDPQHKEAGFSTTICYSISSVELFFCLSFPMVFCPCALCISHEVPRYISRPLLQEDENRP